MKVRVKLFAVAKELAGCESATVEVPPGACLVDVRAALVSAYPALGRVLPHAFLALDAAYAGDDAVVHEGSEVAVIPPVSGGC